MYRYMIITAALIAACITGAANGLQAQTQRTAKGTVERFELESGETSGWQINLEEQLYLGDRLYDTIEIYLPDEDMSRYEGKRVAATGTFVQWRGKQRGKYIVLEICEIVVIE